MLKYLKNGHFSRPSRAALDPLAGRVFETPELGCNFSRMRQFILELAMLKIRGGQSEARQRFSAAPVPNFGCIT